ncbi:glycosyltransferase family 2 protein [Rhodococcus antarcticus]|uniref:Glycosyltransferase family 2 protein n=1 Tax=Rhodococcus antarcticus TaxID=2987751 RepID=A0ABY6NYY9_9NOCA|nr:glycosyltransferase family 2 protein [Rhodococcus antarcticus]UZJ24571.1 glycosyltransferase family 2 protein [Rhodococcus antarcticus]
MHGVRRTSTVLVVIPAWNEELALPAVLAEVAAALPEVDVLVVNDGSTDRTSAVAREAGVVVIDLPINLGVGGAMRAGFRYARTRGHQVVVQLDGDGQHDPLSVRDLLAELAATGSDVVIGARFAGAGSYEARGPRRAAMKVLSVVLSRLVGTRLTDTTSGFKASGPKAVALFARDYPAEYLGDTVESLVIAARAGLVVSQHPVAMRPRSAGTPSHSPVKATIFLFRAFAALAVAVTRPRSTVPAIDGDDLS